MNNVTTVAIAKGIKKAVVDKASDSLDAGTYPVDTIVHLQGSIHKAEDSEMTVHMQIPYAKLVLALLSKVNQQIRVKTIDEAIAVMDNLTEEDELAMKEVVKGSWERLTDKAKKVTKGKVTTKLTFDVLNSELAGVDVVEEAREPETV